MTRLIGSTTYIQSHKIFFKNINTIIQRKYETIIKPPQPPSAFQYQIYKLQQKNSNTLFSRLTIWSARHPLILATSIATIKSGVCDWIAQCIIEKRDLDTFNWSRFALFGLFGFFYCGFVQYGIYNKLYPMLFKHMKKGFIRNFTNTITDMSIHSTLFYFPAFYIFKGFVYEGNISINIVKQQLYQYFGINFKADMIDLYKVWFPTIFLMFTVIPIQYRVPWISFVGSLWAVILSLKRGDADNVTSEIIETAMKEFNEIPIGQTEMKLQV
eukprot:119272_1